MKKYNIEEIELHDDANPEMRKIFVSLDNGTTITIESCQEAWEQYGGTEEELYFTMPIAEYANDWLHDLADCPDEKELINAALYEEY